MGVRSLEAFISAELSVENNASFIENDEDCGVNNNFVFSDVRVPPEPKIIGGDRRFLAGETFTINCTVEYQPDSLVNLFWIPPGNTNVS